MDSPARSGGNELITNVTATDGAALTVTVIDPKQRVMAVYHVDRGDRRDLAEECPQYHLGLANDRFQQRQSATAGYSQRPQALAQ